MADKDDLARYPNAPFKAAALTLAGALILITPLCGLLFGCGCTWPGLGLAEHCNFFDPSETRPCPFCARLVVSVPLLTGITLTASGISSLGISRKVLRKRSVVLDSLAGLIAFGLLTTASGSMF